MNKITVLIPTYNSSSTIENALKSILWADEIIVVDSYSTDNTLEVLKKYNVFVYQRTYDTPSLQKNWALQFCSNEWVLQLDSDEVLEPNSESIIGSAINYSEPKYFLFLLPRKNHVLGKWVRYGGLYPDFQTRLFNHKQCKFNDRLVHEKIEFFGSFSFLKCHILHYGMPSISAQLNNFNRYTNLEFEYLKITKTKFSHTKWILFPFIIFIYKYFWKMGFRDGWRGYFLAIYTSFYWFIYYSKLKENEVFKLKKSP